MSMYFKYFGQTNIKEVIEKTNWKIRIQNEIIKRLELLGLNIDSAVSHDIHYGFETYLFDNCRIAIYEENNCCVISIMMKNNWNNWKTIDNLKID